MTPEERRKRLYKAMDNDRRTTPGSRRRSTDYIKRSSENRGSRRRKNGNGILKVILALLLVVVLIFGIVIALKGIFGKKDSNEQVTTESVTVTEPVTTEPETISLEEQANEMLETAGFMAMQYDYDGALEYVAGFPEFAEIQSVKDFIAEIETTKSTLVKQDVTQITHIFFHILVVDKQNAFDTNRWGKQAKGYNSLMTTIPEFEKILQSMYDRGYVLVSLHDMGHLEVQEDGTEKMVTGNIMLPPGKKAFVMSEDDVCYYEYMKGAGFADKMIIGENGKPTLHYTDKDGNEYIGDYDIVPILDKFIEEHPDFSYKGHKACLVFTGYNGVLGYRTDETYLPENCVAHKVESGHDVEAERAEAVKVLKALYEDGYDLGCHSWGHRSMGEMSVGDLKTDMEKWDKNVNSLIFEATGKNADILIYPKGDDIGDWRGYDSDSQNKDGCSEKYEYLTQKGFCYFCNVDSAKVWVQIGSDYIRTGRRALDGYNFYKDITKNLGMFTDLWDNTSDIFDKDRPTPVESY